MLYRFFEISSPDAPSAHAGFPDPPVFLYPDSLKVRQKTAFCFVVRVADIVAHRRTFTAKIACPGHVNLLFMSPVSRICTKAFMLREKTWIANIKGNKMQER